MSYFSDRSGPSYRQLNLLGLVLCGGTLSFAVLYLQNELGLDPCPLCTATRLLVLVQGALFLLAFVHNPRQLGQRAYALLGLVVAAGGIVINLRHAWLQRLPAGQVPECGPGLDYLFQALPPRDALQTLFSGAGQCTQIQWQLLGLTLPEQSLLLFALVTVALLSQFRKRRERNYFS